MEYINEMSMAWMSSDPARCAWVENPTGYANKYFKYLNSKVYKKADKVARISLLEPKYLVHRNFEGKDQWVLTNKEKRELVKLLNQPSSKYPNCSNWQALLITYNEDNFGIEHNDTINMLFSIKDYPEAFDINTSMPNYLELE